MLCCVVLSSGFRVQSLGFGYGTPKKGRLIVGNRYVLLSLRELTGSGALDATPYMVFNVIKTQADESCYN